MSWKAPVQTKFERELLEAGTYVARCYSIVDLGTTEVSYMGGDPKPRHEMRFVFEIPEVKREFKTKEGKEVKTVASISQNYTFSLNEKANLRKNLESWQGAKFTDEEAAEFDIESVLGKSCMLAIIHKEGKEGAYAVIGGISKMMKGLDDGLIVHEQSIFRLDDFSQEKFDKLPERVRERIQRSDEWKVITGTGTKEEAVMDEDGVPPDTAF